MVQPRSRKKAPRAGPPAEAAAAPGEARYSIRVTSRLTAIELDTLRMWERRYGFPRPRRTSGGSRVYSEADVEALKLIRRALEHGYRPGEVVGKSPAELRQLILVTSAAAGTTTTTAPTLTTMLAAVGRDDLSGLRAELRRAATLLGPVGFVVEVAHPLCVRVGELWEQGQLEVRHEHLLSECLSVELRVLLAAFEDRPGAPRVLLATLPSERHGLGLVMAAVYLASKQVTPVLLGVDTPGPQIVRAAQSHQVDAVGLLVTAASDLAATAKQIRSMLTELPRRVRVWIRGAAGSELTIHDDAVRIVGSWALLDAAISTLARKPELALGE